MSSAWFQRRDVPAIAVWTEQLKLKQQEEDQRGYEASLVEQDMLERDRRAVAEQKRTDMELREKHQAYQRYDTIASTCYCENSKPTTTTNRCRDLEKLIEVRRRAQLEALTNTMSDVEKSLNQPLLVKAGVL